MKPLFIFCFFISQFIIAQKNEFLNRGFWKLNPDIKKVKEKINEGNDPTQLNRFGFDALGYALIENTNFETLKFLQSIEGNDVNKLTHDGRTYVFWAAYRNNIAFIKYLINKGAKLDIVDDKGYNVINFAAVTGQVNPELYNLFISKGVKINDLTPKGANALLLIAPNLKDLSFLEYFKTKGLKINDVDHQGNGIFNYATTKENKKILDDLIKAGVPYKNLNNVNGNAYLFATKRAREGYNSLEFFKYLENLGVNPNMITKDGKTPLHNLSSACKDIATFQYFIDKGVNVNSTYKDGNNALINAAYKNDIQIVDFLIKNTKNINKQNKKGISALSNAVKGNSPKTVELLIKNGAKTNVIDKKGNNLMVYLMDYYAAKNKDNFLKKLTILKDSGLDVEAKQENGNTLYHLAISKNSLDLLQKIQSLNQNINAKNNNGYTPLQEAVMSTKNIEIVKKLISLGANSNVTTEFNESVFDLASENEALKNTDLNFLKI